MRILPALLILCLTGCTFTFGWKFNPETIRGFKIGQTTVQDARLEIGYPISSTKDSEGNTTYVWVYFHGAMSDFHEQIRAELMFGPDGKLLKWAVTKPLQIGAPLPGDVPPGRP